MLQMHYLSLLLTTPSQLLCSVLQVGMPLQGIYLSYFTILERICWLSFLFFTCLKTYGGSYQSRKCCFVVSNRAFKTSTDIIGSLTKSVPDFCTVYIVSKSKAITAKSASRSPTSGNKIRVKRPYLDFNQ